MRSDLVPSFLKRAEELLAAGRFQNSLAQCHSRDVLRYLGTPQSDWPEYSASLDEDLIYTSHYLLYIGLKLKTTPDAAARGDECLILGAEILEYLYSSYTYMADPERVTQVFSAALAYYMAGHFARAYVLVRDLEATEGLPALLGHFV